MRKFHLENNFDYLYIRSLVLETSRKKGDIEDRGRDEQDQHEPREERDHLRGRRNAFADGDGEPDL